MLAAIFMKIEPVTGCPLGMSGKSLENTGDKIRARKLTTPPFSPTFITPNQRANTPVSPKDISNAVFEEENVESIIAGNTSMSPQKINFTTAITKASRKKATQI
jgi:hypothetical protein